MKFCDCCGDRIDRLFSGSGPTCMKCLAWAIYILIARMPVRES